MASCTGCERPCMTNWECSYCESCQSSCESSCQSSCQRNCQTSCETSCQTAAQKNRAPSTPGNFTLPNNVMCGENLQIIWGSGTDPDGDPLTYTLQRSIDNGSWTTIYTGSSINYTDLVSREARQLRYRVRSNDRYTSSGYRTSNIITVINNYPPTISGADEDLGIQNRPFEKTFTVDDLDTDQELTVTITLNGGVIKEYRNATRNHTYKVDITDERLKELPINQRNTINVTVTDGTVSTSRNWRFTRTNLAPEITVEKSDYGLQNKEFEIKFSAIDPDDDEMEAKIYLNGNLVEHLGEIEAEKEVIYKIRREDFISLRNGEHKVRIDVEDSVGSVTSSFVAFEKMVTWYLYEYIEELPNKPENVRIDMLANIVSGTVKKIEVCNNVQDEEPTWEEISDGNWHKFENTNKTADKWGLGVRVRLDRVEAKSNSYIYGFNISYA